MADESGVVGDDVVAVRSMLGAALISASEDEVTGLALAHRATREMVASLYAVAEARDEIPAMFFRVRP